MKKTFFILSLIPITLTILIFPYIQDDLILFARILIYGLIGLSFAAAIAFLFLLREKFLTIQAQRKKAQLESSLVISNGETWVQEHIFKTNEQGKKELTIEYARLGGIRHRVNSHDHNPTPSEILYAQTMLTTGQSKMLSTGQMAVLPPVVPLDLLSLLDKSERVLIKGASDAGKTTLLQHIVSRSKGVFVIDPHYAPDVWPISSTRVVGAARNYQAIDTFLLKLIDELNSRYERRAKGENNFEQITLVIDEFNSIKQECDHAGKILSTLIRESRKVGFRLFLGSHSELVKPLGLEGQGDIREGLLIVRLEIDQITKQRKATIDTGNGEKECYFPPFNNQSKEVLLPDLVIQPNNEDGKILQLISENTPYHVISQTVWGEGKIGSYYNRKIDAILARYNLKKPL